MVQRPLGLVEVGRDPGPVLVMGLESDGPFARVLAGQQPGQPGGPHVGGFSQDGHVCLGGVRLPQVYWHPQQRTTAGCHQSGSEILPALRVWVFSSRPPAAAWGLKALAGVGNNPAAPLVGRVRLTPTRGFALALAGIQVRHSATGRRGGDNTSLRVVGCLPASASGSGCRLDPCRPRRRQSVWRFPTTTGSARFRLPAAGSLASPSVSGWCRLRGRPRRSSCGRTLRRRILLLAFCASGPETSLQRLSRSGTRLLAGYRAGYALHQLHLPLGSEGGAFGDLFNAAFADQFLLTENCEPRFAFF